LLNVYNIECADPLSAVSEVALTNAEVKNDILLNPTISSRWGFLL